VIRQDQTIITAAAVAAAAAAAIDNLCFRNIPRTVATIVTVIGL